MSLLLPYYYDLNKKIIFYENNYFENKEDKNLARYAWDRTQIQTFAFSLQYEMGYEKTKVIN